MAEPITCPITPWYTKRMSLMTVMFVGFGLYFLYDGLIGYPKKNEIYRAHQTFVAVQQEREAFFREGGSAEEWEAVVEEKGYPAEADWVEHAAVQGWPEEPPEKLYSTGDQFFFGGLCLLIGFGVLGTLLANRGRELRADDDSFYTPSGERVPFASTYRIDLRKWDAKGLGYVHYRDESGKEKRAVIDDLKFAGAEAIRQRLMENFQGELVERVSRESNGRTERGAEAVTGEAKDPS